MKLNERAVAVEVVSTGWCPLDCDYCYIPKTDETKNMHENIVNKLRSGEWIDKLDDKFENLHHVGFWGTEPLLILDIVTNQIDDLVNVFPNIKTIEFSTSLCLNPLPIKRLKDKLNEYDIDMKWQVSADGHYTDINRMDGATQKIKDNLKKLAKNMDKFTLKWKPTISIDNIEDMANNPDEVEKFLSFYKDMKEYVLDINDNVEIAEGSYAPTLVVPGKYTSDDGKIFAKYIENMRKYNYDTAYTNRLKRVMNYSYDLDRNPSMFTCSGGDSNFGFDDGNIHICHRTFYQDRNKYIESIKQQKRYDNWDVSLFEDGTINMIKDKYIVGDDDLLRFEYVMRSYHDYLELKLNHTNAIIIELAKCGQADDIYMDNPELRETLALFLHTSHSCPAENLLNTGVVHFMPVSMIRLWANGAFQELLKTVGDNNEF